MTEIPMASHPQILYQDDDILVINKPPGLLSVPDGYDATLLHVRQVLTDRFPNLWMVHRLDKDTSGAMILALNAESHRNLNRMFRERNIKKLYHGLVTPRPNWHQQTIQLPLRPDADRRHRTRVDPGKGKPAHSECQVIKRFGFGVWMSIQIRTGITHQIRAHLRAHGLTLLGETLYTAGLPEQPIAAPRMMLHARKVSFDHPTNGKPCTITAPFPDDFREILNQLKITRAPDSGI
jgi:RluA family pseudouridine synthase